MQKIAIKSNTYFICGTGTDMLAKHEFSLIECSDGILTPINGTETFLDLIVNLSFPIILVVKNGLGAINHCLLSINIIDKCILNFYPYDFRWAGKHYEAVDRIQCVIIVIGLIITAVWLGNHNSATLVHFSFEIVNKEFSIGELLLLMANDIYVCSIVVPVFLCLLFSKNKGHINTKIAVAGMILAGILGISSSIYSNYYFSYAGITVAIIFTLASFKFLLTKND